MLIFNLNNSCYKFYHCVKWTLIWSHYLMLKFKDFCMIDSCKISLNSVIFNEYKRLSACFTLVIICMGTGTLNCLREDLNVSQLSQFFLLKDPIIISLCCCLNQQSPVSFNEFSRLFSSKIVCLLISVDQ